MTLLCLLCSIFLPDEPAAPAKEPNLNPPPAIGAPTTWKYDVVRLKNGHSFQGLILEENALGIKFQSVTRRPGRPTVTFTSIFKHQELDVRGVLRLPDADRALLKARLEALDPTGMGELGRMNSVTLKKLTGWVLPIKHSATNRTPSFWFPKPPRK